MNRFILGLILIFCLLLIACSNFNTNVDVHEGGEIISRQLPGGSMTYTAFPAPGFIFSSWTKGDETIRDNPLVVQDHHHPFQAIFEPVRIDARTSPEHGGKVISSLKGPVVTLQAIPSPGFRFSHWAEGDNPFHEEALLVFTPCRHRQVQAVFELAVPDVGVTPTKGGLTRVTNVPRGEASFHLQALPLPGFIFLHWQEEDLILSDKQELFVTDREPGTITAVFSPGLTPIDGACILAPVSKQITLGKHIPPDLKPIPTWLTGGRKLSLRPEALTNLDRMGKAAQKDGITLEVVSAFRSFDNQLNIFNSRVRKHGALMANQSVARPGQSEHQLGTTVDFGGTSQDYSTDFAETRQAKWLQSNAWKFGFVMSYPPGSTDITGYIYEPWHYRYVGLEHAQAITVAGVIPQIYLDALYIHSLSQDWPLPLP